jgi:hypothetical protein
MHADEIRFLYDYDRWATRRVLSVLDGLESAVWMRTDVVGERVWAPSSSTSEGLEIGYLLDHGSHEPDDPSRVDPSGIEVRVVDSDIPATGAGAQSRGGGNREFVPGEAPGLRVIDRGKRLRRQHVEVEMEPPLIGKRRTGRRRGSGGIGRETLTVDERHPVT